MKNNAHLIIGLIKNDTNVNEQHAIDILKPTIYLNRTRESTLRIVRSYMEKCWKLKVETHEYYLLTRTNVTLKGHLIIAISFGWWLLFIPNLIYHLAMQEEKKIYKFLE
jgi:hypothetical protein